MRRHSRLLAALAALVLVMAAGVANAQRSYGGGRNSTPMTPFGPQFDPKLWQQSGGNLMFYQQLVQQRAMQQQMKQMETQSKQMQKQAQQWQKQAQQLQKAQAAAKTQAKKSSPTQPQVKAKRKKRITPPITATKPREEEKTAADEGGDAPEADEDTDAEPAAAAPPTPASPPGASGPAAGRPDTPEP